jgi:competence protein ComEC
VVALGAGIGCLRGAASGIGVPGEEAVPLVAVEGVVTRGVDVRADPFAREHDATARIATFEARLGDAADRETGVGSFGAVVHVRLEDGAAPPDVLPGDRVRVIGRSAPVRRPSNPGQADRRARLARRGITHDVRAPSPRAVLDLGTAPVAVWLPRRWGEQLRRVVLARLRAACGGDGPAQALLACLLVGDRAGIDDATRRAFRRAGVAHLLSVSGLHVVLLTTVLATLGRAVTPVRARGGLALPATLAMLIVYCAVCRFSTPVVRAAVFLSVRAIANRAGRRSTTLDQLGTAACLVLAAAPTQILDTGFQLSFAAVAGLVLLTRGIRRALFGHLELLRRFPEALPRWRLRLYLHLAAAFSASCAAQFATAPVVASAMGELHAVGALTNLAAVPLAATALPVAALLALAGDLVPLLTAPVANAVHLAMTTVVDSAPAAPPLLSAPGPAGAIPVAVSTTLLLLAARVRAWRARHLLLPIAAWAVLVGHPHVAAPVARAELLVLDVGHGSCALVRSRSGADVLFDAGGRLPAVGRRVILPALRSLGVRRLAAVVVSHDDADHCGAVPLLVSEVRVDEVVVPAGFGGSAAAHATLEACAQHGVPVRRVARGDVWTARGVVAEVLHPGAATGGPARNTGSLVAHVTVHDRGGDLRVLFPGDIADAALEALAADPTVPGAEALLLPHHGLEDPLAQLDLARRVGARILVASASRATPAPFPAALVTGRHGALRIRAGKLPWSFLTGSRVSR